MSRVAKALGEKFTFTLKNNTGATKVVAILAAFFDTLTLVEGAPNTFKQTNAAAIAAAGYSCDAVLDDGTIITDLSASSANSRKSIRAFREFIKTGGAVCVDMDVQANNAAAFNEVIEVVKCTPLTGEKSEYLHLSEFMSVDQSSTSKINARGLDLEMSGDTLMLLPVQNGHEVTITFKF